MYLMPIMKYYFDYSLYSDFIMNYYLKKKINFNYYLIVQNVLDNYHLFSDDSVAIITIVTAIKTNLIFIAQRSFIMKVNILIMGSNLK